MADVDAVVADAAADAVEAVTAASNTDADVDENEMVAAAKTAATIINNYNNAFILKTTSKFSHSRLCFYL